METISYSVGRDAKNLRKDVMAIQSLLNKCLHLLIPLRALEIDGFNGPTTISVIEDFQERVLKSKKPDGKVDPGGKTLRTLNQKKQIEPKTENTATFSFLNKAYFNSKRPLTYKFPLKLRPTKSYKNGMRKFGSKRSKGRLHAGSDLYAKVGTPVYAMDDGEVEKAAYAFYLGTYAIEIKHTEITARYGELGKVESKLKKGSTIKKGQLIGHVGELKGLNMSMLHLELYTGDTKGPLTNRKNTPYKRRSDLIDPTPILDKAK